MTPQNNSPNDMPTLPLEPPTPRQHSFFGFKKSAKQEIADLRQFIGQLLEKATPEGYKEAAEEMHAMRSVSEQALNVAEEAKQELKRLLAEEAEVKERLVEVNDIAILQEIGIYDYRHQMDTSEEYKERRQQIRSLYKQVAKDWVSDTAAASRWTVSGSEAKGRKMVREVARLLLRAYNNEADTLVDKLRPFKLEASLDKLEKSRAAINRLGEPTMGVAIDVNYHNLRKQELDLTADWLAKKEEEKEVARAERERLQEEAKAKRELEAEKAKLEKEHKHYVQAIEKLRASEDADEVAVAELEAKLAEVDGSMESVDQRSANVRAGHVYVISNIGSFGERVVKIGMTRRLDPMDRIRELGDASVPFRFDLHAMVFSDDAVSLENDLHKKFSARRLNLVNLRREFFYISFPEVMEAINASGHQARIMEYQEIAEAEEWRTSENTRHQWEQQHAYEGVSVEQDDDDMAEPLVGVTE